MTNRASSQDTWRTALSFPVPVWLDGRVEDRGIEPLRLRAAVQRFAGRMKDGFVSPRSRNGGETWATRGIEAKSRFPQTNKEIVRHLLADAAR
jgi:hypothetical protein